MGYYTRYNLKIDPPQTLEFVNALGMDSAKISEWVEYEGAFQPWGGDETKWYEWEEETRAASAAHPELLFTLDGEGEESGDVWRAYFKDGLMQLWRMPNPNPEPFDAAKLK